MRKALEMNFEKETQNNYTLIRSKVDKLDTVNAPELKSELVYLNKQGVNNLIIDMSETRYCDSSGLSSILVANRLCKGADGALILTGLQDAVMKLITISQLHTVLNITSTVEEAIDLLSEDVQSEE